MFWHFVSVEYCSECQCESCSGETKLSYKALLDKAMRESSSLFLSTGILTAD